MVFGTRDNPSPEFPWPSLLLTYFFVKFNEPTIHMKTANLSLGPENSGGWIFSLYIGRALNLREGF